MNDKTPIKPELDASSLLDVVPIGILHLDSTGTLMIANKKALAILGICQEEIIGKRYENLDWKHYLRQYEEADLARLPILRTINQGESIKELAHGIEINGVKKWILEDTNPIYDDEHVLIGCVSSFVDITSDFEHPMRGADQTASTSNESVPVSDQVLVIIHELDFSIKSISSSLKDILGYDDHEMMKIPLRSLIHREDLHSFELAFSKAGKGKRNVIRCRWKHKKGSHLWFEHILYPVFRSENEISQVKSILNKIHEQKIAEDRLVESEVRYQSLIDETPLSISIYDSEGVLIKANPSVEKVWDIKIDGMLGKFNIRKERLFRTKKFSEVVTRAFEGERGEFIGRFLTVKGKVKDLHIHYFPLKDPESEISSHIVFITEEITAKLLAEKEANEGEVMKQSILDSLEDALLVVDKEGNILSINQRLKNYLARSKYPMAEVGDDVFKFLDYFEERTIIKNGLEDVLNRHSTFFDYEVKLVDKKWYNLKVTQLKSPVGAVISWQNINTRKEIEIALEKSLKKYRNIYNRAPVMMHSINATAEIMSVSDFWLEKMDYERKEVIGKKITDFLADQSFEEMEGKLMEFYEKKFLRNEPYLFKTKKGQIIEVLLSATPEYDEVGNFERSLTGMVDITELRKTERELKKSQRNLMDAQRISKIGNFELNLKNYQFKPSPELTAMLGFEQEGQNIRVIGDLVYPADRDEFMQKLNHSATTGEDFFHVYRILHLQTGKTKWMSGRGRVIKGSSGSFERIIGTFQDISEQRVAEEKIQRLSDRILLATELAKIGVWEHSEEDREVYWDKNMFEIFDSLEEPIKGIRELSKYIVHEELPLFWEIVEKMKMGFRFVEGNLKINVGSGVKYLKTHTRIIRDENNRITRAIGVLYDNTEDKKLQLELETSLEEKNILLKEVHHRVKNNMQLVSSILALKAYDLNDDDSKRIFDEVNDRIKSMAVIHDQLYKFYNVSEINISEYLNHIAGELRVLLGSEHTKVEVEADDKLFDVDKMLLFGLIVSELVSNAFKHGFEGMEGGGSVRIMFKTLGSSHSYLAVLNDGKPIPDDIFDSKSSGLGLSLIKTFAKQLNGVLSLHPENGIVIRFQ